MQERLLDTIYEGVVAYSDEFVPDLHGVTDDRPEATLHVEDPEGNCWQIIAVPHPHLQK